LGLDATIAAWQHSQPWLDSVVATLDGNRRFVAESIARDFPGVVHHLPEATYLAWLDVRDLDLGSHPAKFFLEKARVALNEGRTFGERFDGYVRLNYATSRELLGDILERMLGALAQR
jgi:cystathionine beta-lyase